jgi:hypothetical protein
MANLPAQPLAPTVYRPYCTRTSLYVSWTAVVGGDIATLGYQLFVSSKGSGQFTKIYDGSQNPDTLSYNVTGLTTGQSYSFYVIAVNYNGISPLQSNEKQALVCLGPSDISPPYYVSSTETSILVGWTSPKDSGGCPITSYFLFINDGLGGAATTPVDAIQITGKPYLSQWDVTGLTQTGNPYLFSIKA